MPPCWSSFVDRCPARKEKFPDRWLHAAPASDGKCVQRRHGHYLRGFVNITGRYARIRRYGLAEAIFPAVDLVPERPGGGHAPDFERKVERSAHKKQRWPAG